MNETFIVFFHQIILLLFQCSCQLPNVVNIKIFGTYCDLSGKPVYMYSMGGLAEYCVVPAHALAVLPNSLPYTESAILGCAVFTAYGAMAHAAEVRPGDAIAVIGIGGVGSR